MTIDKEYPFAVTVPSGNLLLVDTKFIEETSTIKRFGWAEKQFTVDNFRIAHLSKGLLQYKFKYESDAVLFALKWV